MWFSGWYIFDLMSKCDDFFCFIKAYRHGMNIICDPTGPEVHEKKQLEEQYKIHADELYKKKVTQLSALRQFEILEKIKKQHCVNKKRVSDQMPSSVERKLVSQRILDLHFCC